VYTCYDVPGAVYTCYDVLGAVYTCYDVLGAVYTCYDVLGAVYTCSPPGTKQPLDSCTSSLCLWQPFTKHHTTQKEARARASVNLFTLLPTCLPHGARNCPSQGMDTRVLLTLLTQLCLFSLYRCVSYLFSHNTGDGNLCVGHPPHSAPSFSALLLCVLFLSHNTRDGNLCFGHPPHSAPPFSASSLSVLFLSLTHITGDGNLCFGHPPHSAPPFSASSLSVLFLSLTHITGDGNLCFGHPPHSAPPFSASSLSVLFLSLTHITGDGNLCFVTLLTLLRLFSPYCCVSYLFSHNTGDGNLYTGHRLHAQPWQRLSWSTLRATSEFCVAVLYAMSGGQHKAVVLLCLPKLLYSLVLLCIPAYLGLARTMYLQCMYGVFAGISSNVRSYTAYLYTRFWPTLCIPE